MLKLLEERPVLLGGSDWKRENHHIVSLRKNSGEVCEVAYLIECSEDLWPRSFIWLGQAKSSPVQMQPEPRVVDFGLEPESQSSETFLDLVPDGLLVGVCHPRNQRDVSGTDRADRLYDACL